MEIGQIDCDNLGMSRDTSISALSKDKTGVSNYAYDNHNIRILAVNDNTKYSVTNEKSTVLKTGKVAGSFLGSCKISNYLVIFTTDTNIDYIYRLDYDGTNVNVHTLYSGDLNFSKDHAIEAIGYYESELVQKVYWVDGLNQNRFINIIVDDNYYNSNGKDNTQFDFQGNINYIPTVQVTKTYDKAGTFQAGVIQYFITYYNKYGQETCIAWNSDLQYISMSDRGAKADESVACAFEFEISNIDITYDYLRLYAIYRSGLNGVADGRLVSEIKIEPTWAINKVVKFTDLGNLYTTVNAKDFPYIGGQSIIANTLEQKEDTLFLGDLKQTEHKLAEIKAHLQERLIERTYEGITIKECLDITWLYKNIETLSNTGIYPYKNQNTESQKTIAGFKYRELYRFGIQFMDKKGDWTSACWIGDSYCPLEPTYEDTTGFSNACIAYDITDLAATGLISNYVAYRILIAETSAATRRIVAQGVLNPTMFNYYDREYNRPYSVASWMFRPRQSSIVNKHYDTMALQTEDNAEIQGVVKRKVPGYTPDSEESSFGNYDAYQLFIAADRGHKAMWRLIYYDTSTCADFDAKDSKGTLLQTYTGTQAFGARCESNKKAIQNYTVLSDLQAHTSRFHIPASNGYKIISEGKINKTKWSDVQSEVYSSIVEDCNEASIPVVISPAMLPSADEWRKLGNAESMNAAAIWTAVTMAIVTVAAVVATIFSWGAAAPALAAVAATEAAVISSSLAATILAANLCAAAAITGIGVTGSALYDATEKSEDIDTILARKGYISLTDDHTNSAQQFALQSMNAAIDLMYDGMKRFTSFGNNYFNAYVVGGRLTALTKNERDTLEKQNAYYVDESIVTMNTPEFDSVQSYLENTDAYDLQLVGVIPVESVESTYDMQTLTAGYNNQAQVLKHRNVSNWISNSNYNDDNDVLGLVNGKLYQDTQLSAVKEQTSESEEAVHYVNAQAGVVIYKTFMWHRVTSWSALFNNLEVRDVYNNIPEETPAQPKRKLFANLRYSFNTKFEEPYTLDIEKLITFNSDQVTLKEFEYGSTTKFYYGNVDTVVVPSSEVASNELYPILHDDNEAYFLNDDGTVEYGSNDPISIRYKETPHIIIPIKMRSSNAVLLPRTMYEDAVDFTNMYPTSSVNTIVKGLDTSEYCTNYDKAYFSANVTSNIIVDSFDELKGYYGLFDTESEKKSHQPVVQLMLLYLVSNATDRTTIANAWNNFVAKYPAYPEYEGHVATNENLTGYFVSLFFDKTTNDRVKKLYNEFIADKGNKGLLLDYISSISLTDGITYALLRVTNTDGIYSYEDSYSIPSGTKLLYIKDATRDAVPYVELPAVYNNVYYTTTESVSGFDPDDPEGFAVVGNFSDRIWQQEILPWTDEVTTPYLFMAELVKKDFDYDNWYNGYSDYALQQLTWNIASNVTPIASNVELTWGDTFYQRWDCEKTYPFTEEDKNSIVDILSFMVESHINLDGRCDINRGTTNLLNVRPTNSNILNQVYSQPDNFFSYKLIDDKFDSQDEFGNEVAWSLTKQSLDDVDKWTNITGANVINLDGHYGTVRKILNVNDNLIAFQDKALSRIKFNESAALTTQAGLPLQIGNTGKVEGYQKIVENIGCHNKFSISKNNAGVFFIDDYNRTFNTFTANGCQNLGITAEFSLWFKENIDGTIWSPNSNMALRASFDNITNDLYLINRDVCLVYNPQLQRFTSFMDYYNTPLITNMNSDTAVGSFAFQNGGNVFNVYQMFAGDDYGTIYDYFRPYSIEYRLNPVPTHDSIFTNYSYVADWTDPSSTSDQTAQFDDLIRRFTTFDTVEATNEYQHGIMKITPTRQMGRHQIQNKFRVWRGDIPRDGDTEVSHTLGSDRMRNPWIRLRFEKTLPDNSKMTFHNLIVTYYNQYGRY